MRNAILNVSTGQVRTIRLYGPLGAKFGRVHRMAINSAAEAVHALGSQIEGFTEHLVKSKDKGIGYAVFYGKRNLAKEELTGPCGHDDIRIAPMMMGAKNGWFQIIIGVVLVVVGAYFEMPALVQAGYSMIIGGVIQLLSPHPKGTSSKDKNNEPNYSFNGPINTQAQGYPVPVLYGELFVGSAVLSAGILAVDVYVPQSGGGSGTGGSSGGGAGDTPNTNPA